MLGRKWISVPVFSLFPVCVSGPSGAPFVNDISYKLPFLRILILSFVDRALTTDTPTPCNPPEILYELLSNFPPACKTVMTISGVVLPSSSSGCTSVGMPLPLSETVTELSVWITIFISSQCPANASSIELSTTSKTIWCKPVPSLVSPIYIPGLFLTASSPFSTLILSALYSLLASIYFPISNSHRHNDILE